jgi:hypothetical protein
MNCPWCGAAMEPMDHGRCPTCQQLCGCSFNPTSSSDWCRVHRPPGLTRFQVGDRVVKNVRRWRASDFDHWGAGEGLGEVVAVDGHYLDIRWPAGRCYQRADEVVKA